MPLYFEDFTPGRRFTTPACTLSEGQIMDFAFTYDPQPFHIDKHAEGNPYGGIIASGFQTLAVAFRLFHQTNTINACSMGSPGMDELRWLRPVRPGDSLHVEAEVLEQRASSKRPDRGTVTIGYSVVNHEGESVMTFRCLHIFRKAPEAA